MDKEVCISHNSEDRCKYSYNNTLECVTVGKGELLNDGIWQYGCHKCARDYEKEHNKPYVWPFSEKQIAYFKKVLEMLK